MQLRREFEILTHLTLYLLMLLFSYPPNIISDIIHVSYKEHAP